MLANEQTPLLAALAAKYSSRELFETIWNMQNVLEHDKNSLPCTYDAYTQAVVNATTNKHQEETEGSAARPGTLWRVILQNLLLVPHSYTHLPYATQIKAM